MTKNIREAMLDVIQSYINSSGQYLSHMTDVANLLCVISVKYCIAGRRV